MKRQTLPTKIDRFFGDYRVYSNFYITGGICLFIAADGTPFAHAIPDPAAVEEYDSTEHAFQAGKSLSVEQRALFRIRGVTPGRAKQMGGALKCRPDWEQIEANGRMVKVNFMRDLLLQKFLPTTLRRRLLSTFKAVMIEGNNWHDRFWGVCDGTCKEGPHEPYGENWLGRLLEEVRNFYGGTDVLK